VLHFFWKVRHFTTDAAGGLKVVQNLSDNKLAEKNEVKAAWLSIIPE
jgi:hypothetical protein